jgi:two-component system sensor histidine kinase YesM
MKRYRSKSITFNISLFFVLLNMISFVILFYLFNIQYKRINVENIIKTNQVMCQRVQSYFDDLFFNMNNLTLNMYSDQEINELCNKIMKNQYNSDLERMTIVSHIENICYEYLSAYPFIQNIGIFLDDNKKTDIYLHASYFPNIYRFLNDFRTKCYDYVVKQDGVLCSLDIGETHHLSFARTILDYSSVFYDVRLNGVVSVTVHKQYVDQILRNAVATPNSQAFIVNKDGVISHSVQEKLVGTMNEKYNKENKLRITADNPLVIKTYIKAIDQYLVLVTPLEDVILHGAAFTNTQLVFAVLVAILNFILVNIISKLLARPMQNFVLQINKIGNTNVLDHIDVRGYKEIEEIANNFNDMINRIENLINENYITKINEKNARIASLQSQINPHFIFNTLDILNWKTMFLDVPEVTEIISCLGDIFRYTTYNYGSYVKVEQEIMQIKNYLYIQSISCNHSFQEYIIVDEKVGDKLIPCLSIQPIVENAVIHGLKPSEKPGVLVVKVKLVDNVIKIMVFDNGKGMDDDIIKSLQKTEDCLYQESIGLQNVNNRIKLIYGDEYGIKIKSKKNIYTKVFVEMPVRGEADSGKSTNS